MRQSLLWRPLPHPLRGRLLCASLMLLAAFAASGALAGCGANSTPVNTAATSTAGVVIAQQIDVLTRQAVAAYSQQVQTAYDTATHDATVFVTVGWTDDIHAADVAKEQERVKTICFLVQQALWTHSLPLHQVLVTVLGPVTTGYTEQDNDAHGAARMTAPTEAKLSWVNLTPDVAWDRYDEVYLRSDYDPPVVARPPSPFA